LAASVCIHSGEQAKSLLQDHVGELEQLLRDADSRLSDTEVRRPHHFGSMLLKCPQQWICIYGLT